MTNRLDQDYNLRGTMCSICMASLDILTLTWLTKGVASGTREMFHPPALSLQCPLLRKLNIILNSILNSKENVV